MVSGAFRKRTAGEQRQSGRACSQADATGPHGLRVADENLLRIFDVTHPLTPCDPG
jgi:hypothetical protein